MRRIRWSAALTGSLVASLFIVGEAQAQMPLHLAAGPTLGTISTDDPDFEGAETSLGFFAAVGTSFPVGETVAVSPYLGYVQKGAKFGDGQFTFSYDYIEIPVLISTWFPVGETMSWSIFAGPQIGFQINCDEDGFDCSELDSRKGTEFGVMAGTGLQFSDALSVGVGADIGMTDLFDTGGDSFKTRTYWLSLGYSTSLGGSNGNGM